MQRRAVKCVELAPVVSTALPCGKSAACALIFFRSRDPRCYTGRFVCGSLLTTLELRRRPVGALDEGRFCIFVPSYNASSHLPGTTARVPWKELPGDLTYRMVFAVPARLLRWGQARAAARDGWSSDSFAWLARYQPVAVIGNSIFVYEIR